MVQLNAGEGVNAVVEQRGIDVMVRVVGPSGENVKGVDTSGTEGTEDVSFDATSEGLYAIVVVPYGQGSDRGHYEIRLIEVLPAEENRSRKERLAAERNHVIDVLASEAVPVRSVVAGSGFSDLNALKEVFEDVRVVGLGEATHGSREFFQFKHRMLEFLVEEMGFNVFVLEASLAASENVIDRYVQGEPGLIDSVLASQRFWTWNTEEVRDLVEWMRSYNQTAPADARVRFVGIDIQHNDEGKRIILDYLREVAPDRVKTTTELFDIKVDSLGYVPFNSQDTSAVKSAVAQLIELRERYEELHGFLEQHEAEFSTRTSSKETSKVLRHARALAQFVDSYSRTRGEGIDLRDKYMAENFQRFLEGEPADTRVVLWAHNMHIATEKIVYTSLGQHLRRQYGSTYYALGFVVGSGAFQARDADTAADPPNVLRAFQIPSPPEESADWVFNRATARTGAEVAFFDFRSAPTDSTLLQWLSKPQGLFTTGAGYSTTWTPYYAPYTMKEAFDGVVFFKTTTRARPMPAVKNVERTNEG